MIISFNSTTQALKAKRILLKSEVIPTPRSMSASCGVSIRIKGDKDNILAKLKAAGITWNLAIIEK